MRYIPQFSEDERTPQQRREGVKWAVGVAMSQGGGASPELAALYQRYIAGEIDLAFIRAELTQLYPQQPTTDPRYQAGQPDRYYPILVEAAPQQYEPLDMDQPWIG
ncbi:hypothetical protein [Hymenobacter sp. PAMC 26628]|uniref:hypothetical protein n=1 Tax=Hymenobacter sp. PAMC 26628 TaxID=1484118 RepID=UPI0007701D76|nr:hypothetical protein [Hymenobacter sp. PAMC 26628]AMJ64043.1 hypothetical protein AXW84_00310 [Hymenobacter sp. PAMC 26628]